MLHIPVELRGAGLLSERRSARCQPLLPPRAVECLLTLAQANPAEANHEPTALRPSRRFASPDRSPPSGPPNAVPGAAEERPHYLTRTNCADLLREASGKSKRAIEALLAARFPQPDAASKIRKLPKRDAYAAGEQPALALETPVGGAPPATTQTAEPRPKPAQPARDSRVEPLSAARYKVQFTASSELKDKLERARNLLSHANPRGDLAVIMERAIDLLLAELERTKLGKTERPRRARARQPGAVTRTARREVFERDGEQCTFVSADGRRCQAKVFIELDHVRARAHGGCGESHNVRLLCAGHNKLLARPSAASGRSVPPRPPLASRVGRSCVHALPATLKTRAREQHAGSLALMPAKRTKLVCG